MGQGTARNTQLLETPLIDVSTINIAGTLKDATSIYIYICDGTYIYIYIATMHIFKVIYI